MNVLAARTVALIPAIGLSALLNVSTAQDVNRHGNGAQQDAEQQQPTAQGDARSAHGVRVSEVIGMNVRNARGEDLGEIEDLVIDLNNERVHYAILAFGGIAGMGEKLFAYPMHVFTRDANTDSLVLEVDEDRLESAPGFDRDQWPDWHEPDGYRAQVDSHFGPTVQVQARPDMLLRRASQLIDADITSEGRGVGDVDDLVIAMPDGQVRFVVAELDSGWADPDRLILLPLRAFERDGQSGEELALVLDRDQVATAPGFPSGRWPDLDTEYRSELNAWFDNFDIDEATADAAAGTVTEEAR